MPRGIRSQVEPNGWPVTADNERSRSSRMPGQARWYRGGARSSSRRPRESIRPRKERACTPVPQTTTASPPRPTSPPSSATCSRSGSPTAPSRRRSTSARARTSGSSTTARRSPTACRTTATCSPATPRTSSRASRPCAASQVHRRFGWDTHGLPAELEAERQLGITDKSEIEEMGIAAFNEAARDAVLRYTKEWQEYVTRQARWVDFENDYKTLDVTFMESVIWAFKTLHDKGLAYEGYRVLPYCWRDQTPLSNHELRMDDDVYKMRQDQTVTVTFPLTGREGRVARAHRRARARLDDHAVDAADELRARRRPRHRVRRRARRAERHPRRDRAPRGAPGRRGDPTPRCSAREYLLAADLVGNYAKELGYDSVDDARAAVVAHRARRRARGRHLRPALRLLRRRRAVRRAERVADPRRRLRHHRRRHRHRAPGARLRRGGPEGRRGRRHPGDPLARRRRPVPAGGHGCRRAALERREQAAHAAAEGRGAAAPPGELRALVPALLALPQSAHLQGGLELVRARPRVPRPHGRAEPGDHLGARERQGRAVRQVGRRRARLVDQPQPLLGLADPGVEERRPRVPARRRVRLARRARARLRTPAAQRRRRARPAPPLHRRADAAEPRRPDRPLDDAPHPRRARRVVRLGFDAVRAGALPVREPGVVRHPPPGRLHRRVHRADARLVLRHARAVDRAVRPAGVQERREPRHRARQRRAEDVEVAAQLPRRQRGLRPRRRRRDALVPDVEPGAARRQPRRHRGGHPRGRAPVHAAALEHVVLLLAVREHRRARAATRRQRRTDSTDVLDRYLLAKLRDLVDRGHRRARGLRHDPRRAAAPRLRRRAHQLVRAPVARPVLGGRRRRRQRHARRSTRCSPCSRRSRGSRPRCCRS